MSCVASTLWAIVGAWYKSHAAKDPFTAIRSSWILNTGHVMATQSVCFSFQTSPLSILHLKLHAVLTQNLKGPVSVVSKMNDVVARSLVVT